ncbi:MAG: hypothetical protein Q9227_000504 [Pyrenula ochraceoflavens]
MAEPVLSLPVVLGLANVALRVSCLVWRVIEKWRDAPAGILALSEEVRRSRHVIDQVHALLKEFESDDEESHAGFLEALNGEVVLATSIWEELERILQSMTRRTPSGQVKLRRDRWVKCSRKIESLRQLLRDVRFRTLEVVSIHTMWAKQI